MNQEVTFGAVVKERRHLRDLTQAELARRVGCATITIRKIEADALRPSAQIAERLAMALAVPLEERVKFVRLARTVRRDTPKPSPIPTPRPAPDEIGEEDLSGRAIRGYELGERIGAGGFGAVYRAVQPFIERAVAIKIILPQYADHPDFIRRFESEAQIVARLEHPHIVPLYDYWREPGVAYLVMRLLRGGSLETTLRQGPMSPAAVMEMMCQIGPALQVAHRIGVIHRDIKPANVLLDEDGNAYLADFGIAKNLNVEDQTQVGAIIGSPDYLSPEQILAEPIRPQTDIYCLGVMLYELLTGRKPFQGTPIAAMIHKHLNEPVPPLDARNGDLPQALDGVIARATAKDPAERYPDILSLLDAMQGAVPADGRAVVSAITEAPLPGLTTRELAKLENPYKGLRPFAEADAADFFGRETLVQTLLGRLGESCDLARFLAVVGPSGSGKSSVAKAGLMPALRRGGLPGSEKWFVVDFMPGSHPLEELEAALLRIAINPPDSLLTQLQEDDRGLVRAVRRILPPDQETELVLVIDQFEELFTLVANEDIRTHFLDSLVTAVLDPRSRLRVVVTMRADFTDRPLGYADFGELMRQRTEFILPLASDELEQAIMEPARQIGMRFEPKLVSTIVGDVGDQPGTLPLLQYALTELFERRDRHKMTLAAYEESGGALGALGRRAEELYAGLDQAGQEATRQLFLRLVTLGEGVEDTRRRVPRLELVTVQKPGFSEKPGFLDTIIDQYGRYRLLTFDHDPVTREPTVEVAHEALLREWKRLRRWLDESRHDIRMQRLLATAAAEWREAGGDVSYLLSGERLIQFEIWTAESSIALTQDEQTFLDAGITGREKQKAEEATRQARETALEQRSRRVFQALAAVFLLAAVISGGLALYANNQRQDALRQASIGLAAQALAELEGEAPERAVLLGLEALEHYPYTSQAEIALALAVEESRPFMSFIPSDYGAWYEVAWSPDGKQIAAGRDGGIITANFATTENNLTLRFDDFCQAESLAWSPDGTRLANVATLFVESSNVTCPAPTVRNAETGKVLVTLQGHTSEATNIDWSTDGDTIVTADVDGTVKLWVAETGEEILSFSAHPGPVTNIAFSPDGYRLATSGEDGVAITWETVTGGSLITLSGHIGSINKLTWSPDGRHLATAGSDGTARIWDAATGAELLILAGHKGAVTSIAWSPNGDDLATIDANGTIRVWNALDGIELFKLRGFAGIPSATNLVWSPDGNWLAAAAKIYVQVWGVSRKSLRLSGHSDVAWSAQWSPDQTQIATGSWDGTARIWDAITGEEQMTLEHPAYLYFLNWSPDGTRLATVDMGGMVRIWDVMTGQELLVKEPETPHPFNTPVWSPDGARIAVNSPQGKTTYVLDAITGEVIVSFSQEECDHFKPSWSPQGDRILTGCIFPQEGDHPAWIWDAVTGELLLTLTSKDGTTIRGDWSPDGTQVVTAYQEGVAKVWDASTGDVLLTFAGHSDRVWDVAWSPDGSRIASSAEPGIVKLWDPTTGLETFSFPTPASALTLAWSPDGQYLSAAGFYNEPIIKRVWQSTEALIAHAKECCVARELTPEERVQFGLPER